MRRLAWIVLGLLSLPLLANAGLFDIGNKENIATKVATLDEDNEIGGLDFSPDGIHLVAMPNAYSRTAHVWNWRSGKIEQNIDEADVERRATEHVRYSPDGRFLARCGNPVKIWDTKTWEIISSLNNISETKVGGLRADIGVCQSLGFTPDGKLLILVSSHMPHTDGQNVIVYDTSTWKPLWGLHTTPFITNTLAISPDGKQAAIGGTVFSPDYQVQSQVNIIDLEQRSIVRKIQQPFPNPTPMHSMEYTLRQLAWNPNGAQIAVGVDDNPTDGTDAVRIFDVQTGMQVANEPSPRESQVRWLRYTPDRKYLIETGIDKKVKIWDGQHNKLLQELSANPVSCAISKDGHFLAIGGSSPRLSDINALFSLIFPGKGKIIIYELK